VGLANFLKLMGVPLRIEFGPKDAANSVVTVSRRDTGVKGTLDIANIATSVAQLLEEIQRDMLSRAKAEFDSHRIEVTNWNDVIPTLNDKNVLLIPHCLDGDCADAIKKETADMCKTATEVDPRAPSMGAKSLCIPFEQKPMPAGTKCLRPSCGKDAKQWLLCGRSY
jgi:prolyl-tRNA synthetase